MKLGKCILSHASAEPNLDIDHKYNFGFALRALPLSTGEGNPGSGIGFHIPNLQTVSRVLQSGTCDINAEVYRRG